MRQQRFREVDTILVRVVSNDVQDVQDVLAMLYWLETRLRPLEYIPAISALSEFLRKRAMKLRNASRVLEQLLTSGGRRPAAA